MKKIFKLTGDFLREFSYNSLPTRVFFQGNSIKLTLKAHGEEIDNLSQTITDADADATDINAYDIRWRKRFYPATLLEEEAVVASGDKANDGSTRSSTCQLEIDINESDDSGWTDWESWNKLKPYEVEIPNYPYDVIFCVDAQVIDKDKLTTKVLSSQYLLALHRQEPVFTQSTSVVDLEGKANLSYIIEDFGFIRPVNYLTVSDNIQKKYIEELTIPANGTAKEYRPWQPRYQLTGGAIAQLSAPQYTSFKKYTGHATVINQKNKEGITFSLLNRRALWGSNIPWHEGAVYLLPEEKLNFYAPPLQMYKNNVQITAPFSTNNKDYYNSRLLVDNPETEKVNYNMELRGQDPSIHFSGKDDSRTVQLTTIPFGQKAGPLQFVLDQPLALTDGLGNYAIFSFQDGEITISVVDSNGTKKDLPFTFGKYGSD